MKKILAFSLILLFSNALFSQKKKTGHATRSQVATAHLSMSVKNGNYSFILENASLNNGTEKKQPRQYAGTGSFVAYILSDQEMVMDTIYIPDPFSNSTDDIRHVTVRFNYRPEMRHIQVHRITASSEDITLGSVPLYLHKAEKVSVQEER
jgi:hypothetical protein